MQVTIFYHHQCFDGAASAAYLGRYFSESGFPDADLRFVPVAHAPGRPWQGIEFDADDHAVVDFKYIDHPKVTWWFDHHESAFLTPDDKSSYLTRPSKRMAWNTAFHSCARLIEAALSERFDYRARDLAPLVDWADVIDGALYPTPADAARFDQSALQLMLAIDHAEADMSSRLVRELMRSPIDRVVTIPEIRDRVGPLREWHQQCSEAIAREGEAVGSVVHCDLTGYPFHRFPKFAPYTLFPDALFAVVVIGTFGGIKVSVGSNPWKPTENAPNLATMCEKHGGGGHRVVAAVTLPDGQIDHARELARQFVSTLEDSSRDTSSS